MLIGLVESFCTRPSEPYQKVNTTLPTQGAGEANTGLGPRSVGAGILYKKLNVGTKNDALQSTIHFRLYAFDSHIGTISSMVLAQKSK